MPRNLTTLFRFALATTATSIAAVSVPVLLMAPQAGAITSPQTLTYQTRLTSLTPVPVAGQGTASPQAGDYVVITDSYTRHGKRAGFDEVHCTLITLQASLCQVAVSLRGGQLELQGIGPAGGTGHFTVAVTGGTGLYANARGTATIVSGADNTGTETFHLLP